jgi:hypothetical protein
LGDSDGVVVEVVLVLEHRRVEVLGAVGLDWRSVLVGVFSGGSERESQVVGEHTMKLKPAIRRTR